MYFKFIFCKIDFSLFNFDRYLGALKYQRFKFVFVVEPFVALHYTLLVVFKYEFHANSANYKRVYDMLGIKLLCLCFLPLMLIFGMPMANILLDFDTD